jgi:SPP1 family phage portal protein
MTNEQIESIVKTIERRNTKYRQNRAYYEGKNPTITDKPHQEKPDIRIAVPIAKKIIHTVGGYAFKEIEYAASATDAEDNTTQGDYQGRLDSILDYNESDLVTLEEFNECATQGRAYELHWFGDEELPEFGFIPANEGMMLYTGTVKPKPYAFVRVITYKDGDDDVTDFYYYDDAECQIWRKTGDSDFAMTDEGFAHAYGEVPAVEYNINAEKMNLFYHVTDLIDELDRVYSNNIGNELAKVAASILMTNRFLQEIVTEDEYGRLRNQIDEMIDGKKWIIQGMDKDGGDFFEWLKKEVEDSFIFGAGDRFERLIYDMTEVPNFSDSEKWGNNVSGVSAAYRLMGFDSLCAGLFAYFSRGLQRRVKLINTIIAQLPDWSGDFPTVEIKSVRQLPKNVLENSMIARNLVGVMPTADILRLFPGLVENPEEAAEQVQEQKNAETSALLGGVMEPRA